jgi:hypothetical protein
MTLFLIDGIAVNRQIYERRRIFGERPDARFEQVDRRPSEREMRRARQLEIRKERRSLQLAEWNDKEAILAVMKAGPVLPLLRRDGQDAARNKVTKRRRWV